MSHGKFENSSLVTASAPAKPITLPVSLLVRTTAARSSPSGCIDAAAGIADRDDRRASLRHQPGGDRTGVAESLHHDPRTPAMSRPRLGRLLDGENASPPGRLVPALRSAQHQRLAGDHPGHRVPDVHRVGVHQPGHDLRVRVDVRRGNVLVGPIMIAISVV